jgi:hypothetical protein
VVADTSDRMKLARIQSIGKGAVIPNLKERKMLYKNNLNRMLRAEFAERRALQTDPEGRLRELEKEFDIPHVSIQLPYGGTCSPIVDKIEIYEDNCFDFNDVSDYDEDSLPEDDYPAAIIFPMFDEFDYPKDLAAIVPSEGKAVTYCGNAATISVQPFTKLSFSTPLMTYLDPLEYIRCGCQGVLILDGPRAASELRGRGLIAPNEAVAVKLRSITDFRSPRISAVQPELYPEFGPIRLFPQTVLSL